MQWWWLKMTVIEGNKFPLCVQTNKKYQVGDGCESVSYILPWETPGVTLLAPCQWKVENYNHHPDYECIACLARLYLLLNAATPLS